MRITILHSDINPDAACDKQKTMLQVETVENALRSCAIANNIMADNGLMNNT